MVGTEYIPGNYKSLRISIGSIMKNPEILRLVLDHLKTKKMFKKAVSKSPFLIRCVADRYKTQTM